MTRRSVKVIEITICYQSVSCLQCVWEAYKITSVVKHLYGIPNDLKLKNTSSINSSFKKKIFKAKNYSRWSLCKGVTPINGQFYWCAYYHGLNVHENRRKIIAIISFIIFICKMWCFVNYTAKKYLYTGTNVISPVPHDSIQTVILVSRDLLLEAVLPIMKGR